MTKWLDIAQYEKIAAFVSPRVLALFASGVAAGVGLFAVELLFAYGLQLLLLAIGTLEHGNASLPSWLPKLGLFPSLAVIFAAGTLRSGLYWIYISMQGAAVDVFRHRQRHRLVQWIYRSPSVSSVEVTTLFTERASSAAQFIQGVQTLAVQLTLSVLLGTSLMLLAPTITVLAGVFLAILVLPLRRVDRALQRAGAGAEREWNQVQQRLLVSIRNLLLLQVYGTQRREERRVTQGLEVFVQHMLTAHRLNALKYVAPQVAGTGLICFIAYESTIHEWLAPGVLLTYFYLFLRFLQAVSITSQSTATMTLYWPQLGQLAKWWADRALDGVRNPQAAEDHTDVALASTAPVGWKVEGVSYAYPNASAPVLTAVSVELEPGRCLVITGASGSGKSTLLALLLGSIEPQHGTVEASVDAGALRPLSEVRPRLLRSIGYVGPESFLIEGSIRDNLCYGLSHVPTQEEFDRALESAECGFVSQLTAGLEHTLTEQGQGLSAGQKQRIALARALLRNPRALILDEATANLDDETEARLVETLARLKGTLTIVAVSHRKSLLKLADRRLSL